MKLRTHGLYELLHGYHSWGAYRDHSEGRSTGKLIIGVLSDEAVAFYKRLSLVPALERKRLFENIARVWKVLALKDVSFFIKNCKIMNDTLAWDLTGDSDPSQCIDIDLEYLYGLEYAEDLIAV